MLKTKYKSQKKQIAVAKRLSESQKYLKVINGMPDSVKISQECNCNLKINQEEEGLPLKKKLWPYQFSKKDQKCIHF